MMVYKVHDLVRICGDLDMYALQLLTGKPVVEEVDSGVLRWARAIEFLAAYVGELGAAHLAQTLSQRHRCPNALSVVNRRVVQVDGELYSLQTGQKVDATREDLKIVMESHALNLAAVDALIERDLRRAPRGVDGGGAHAPSPPGHPK